MRASLALSLTLLAGATASAQDAVDFQRDVLPILAESCFSCHSGQAKRLKGNLRLDGKDWILLGGDLGEVIAPGDAEGSHLFELVSLPADDPDVMPPKGETLTKPQLATLRRWIEAGADFGAWTGAAVPAETPGMDGAMGEMAGTAGAGNRPAARSRQPAQPPARVALLTALGAGVAPAAPRDVAAAREAGAQVEPVVPGSPLLRVQFVSNEQDVDDAALAVLAPLRGRIAHLNLAKTRVTDAGLRALGDLPKLTALNLRKTQVGDAGVAHLVALPELRSLNLFGTAVTDGCVPTLGAVPRLETVYLWSSAVTAAGAQALRDARPDLRVQHALALPAPEERDDDDDRPARKRKPK